MPVLPLVAFGSELWSSILATSTAVDKIYLLLPWLCTPSMFRGHRGASQGLGRHRRAIRVLRLDHRVSVEDSGGRPKIPFLFDHHKEQSSGSRIGGKMMSGSRLSVKASPHSMDFLMDTGNPALNSALDGVLKISGVGAAHAASQEAYSMIRKGIKAYRLLSQIHPMLVQAWTSRSIIVELSSLTYTAMPSPRRDIEKIVLKAGKEGLQWGMVAGIYAGFEYGMEKARGGKHDWKNAAIGGALTGVILSVSDGRVSQDKMVRTAFTASALATAAQFLRLF